MQFANKTVVITGAGSGVGRGYAIGFCADGARVLGLGRTQADLEETARQCGGRMSFIVGDVANPEDVARLFEAARAELGHIDVLINNAAQYPQRSFLESPISDWLQTIATNVNGVALCCHAALPGMLARGHGRIINIGSYAWRKPIPNSAAYSASKGAVRSFTRALASEIDRNRYPDVLINELVPGMVRTRMSTQGETPAEVYRHARFVASLPSHGPHGQTFAQSTMEVETPGLKRRIKQRIQRVLAKLTGA
jgi:NAD(P)-dependent dehydrogenase (short-subunit alcohol dehydrogenase family)